MIEEIAEAISQYCPDAWVIDFDAGRLLSGEALGDLTEELLSEVLKIASGEKTAISENQDHGELAVFKDGVTL